tara:strand:+ start:97 stop:834 length:738 start_codon:yes stop_codon:yes gene_type:complete
MKYNLLFFKLIFISNYSFSQILPSSFAFHHKHGIIKSDLILYLDASNTNSFDSNDLTSWNDLSSSENDLSLVVGGVSFSSDNGGIINFNDDAFRKATFTNFTGNQFTLSMWIKTTQGDGRLFSVARASCCYGKQMVFMTVNSKIDVYGGGNSTSNVNDGTWKFITVVRNSGTYKYYINQNLDVTETGKDSKTFDNNNIVIGWDYRNNSASSGYVGDIGAVYFYDTDLSNEQVTLNYNETKSRFGH